VNDGTRAQLRRIAVLIAIALVDMIGFAIIFPILPFYVLDLDATPFMVGVITAAFSMAQLLSAPIWGRVSDRYGRRPALLIGLLASSVAYVVFGLADAVWLLLLSRLIQVPAAEPRAWRRPTSPTRWSPAAGHGRSAGSRRRPRQA
jgi:MFS family permease